MLVLALVSSACQAPLPAEATAAADSALSSAAQQVGVEPVQAAAPQEAASFNPAPFPERPRYAPGELVDYTAQTGDTLPLLAVRFNTTVEEILQANDFIPASATTMPPGMPMQIPIYYLPLWGSPYQILPDSQFVNGPSQVGFDTTAFVAGQPGWLNGYQEYASKAKRSAAEIIDLVALEFSVSPRLLLALLEHQSGALSQSDPASSTLLYPLGNPDRKRQGLYRQLLWAANTLNDGYYSWRSGRLTSYERPDGQLVRFDPWQNAASASLQNFFNLLLISPAFEAAIGPEGLAQTYTMLFGDPWAADQPHLPGSLEQPMLLLPFEPGDIWAYTGGPHTAWGTGEPLAAIDFAPPNVASGCRSTDRWATALADGVVVRSKTGVVVLDLDGDGDERTGWNIFYLHLATDGRTPLGAVLKAGDRVGHPSCEGGTSTGTHVHIARKYNGEWILASGTLAFDLEGWVASNGEQPYEGFLTRLSRTVIACQCSNQASFIQAEPR